MRKLTEAERERLEEVAERVHFHDSEASKERRSQENLWRSLVKQGVLVTEIGDASNVSDTAVRLRLSRRDSAQAAR
jgi:hypothetical protein